jgi:MFS family permease
MTLAPLERVLNRTTDTQPSDVTPGVGVDQAHPRTRRPGDAGGMFRSLHVRNYRWFTAGQFVSLTGTWMQRVAQDWLVLQLTNSGLALGIVTAIQFLPPVLFGMWGGMLADRGDKRRLLLMTQTGLALAALCLGLLDVAGAVQLWQVYLLAGVVGVITSLDTPIRQAFVVEMVGREDLPNAVGINSTIFNSGRIVGPAVAGVMIAAVGTGWAFIANAVSSVAVITALALMRTSELHPSPRARRGPGALRATFGYVRRRGDLMVAMVLVFIVGTFGANFQLTTALFAKQIFHRSAAGYGLLSTSLAIGAFTGAVLATRRRTRPGARQLIVAAVVFGLVEMAAGLMPTYLLTALALVPAGLTLLTFTTAANSSVQLGVDPTMRGRVMALYLMCFMGGTPVGAPVIGWVSNHLGPRWGMVGGGLLCVVAAVGVAAVLVRRREVELADAVRMMEFRSHRSRAA